jgi:hypothetical protein
MKIYAQVAWTPGDVQTLASGLTDAEAEAWLQNNAKYIQNALVEYGWDVLASLLEYDKIPLANPADDTDD